MGQSLWRAPTEVEKYLENSEKFDRRAKRRIYTCILISLLCAAWTILSAAWVSHTGNPTLIQHNNWVFATMFSFGILSIIFVHFDIARLKREQIELMRFR